VQVRGVGRADMVFSCLPLGPVVVDRSRCPRLGLVVGACSKDRPCGPRDP
jgi:hypothetical protein